MEPKKYTKKPVEIEAMQFDGSSESADAIVEWAVSEQSTYIYIETHPGPDEDWYELHVETLEGIMSATKDWWIIRGVEGEFYPCKDSVFRASYTVPDDVEVNCANHKPVQHRDAKEPWCGRCGKTADGRDPISQFKLNKEERVTHSITDCKGECLNGHPFGL